MSVESRPRKRAAVADPEARNFLRRADPVLARLIDALQGAYEASARVAGWETSGFESKWCPTPTQLHELQATAADEFGRPASPAASTARTQ